MSDTLHWDGFHAMGLLIFSNEWDEFNPLEFTLCIMPFIGYVLFWRALTGFRRANILGRRGKKAEATIILKTDAGSRNLEWNKVTQLQMKIEYEAYDEFADRKVIIEKTLTNIDAQLHDKVNEGYTVNVRYDPINPFMMEIDDEYFDVGRARTGCGRNCCVTLFTFIVAVMFVLIPYWILKAAKLKWYWILIIVVLLPMVMMVISCVSCCVCCGNHDMIAWHKTRNIEKEMRRKEKMGSAYTSRHRGKSGNKKGKEAYRLMEDEFT